MNPPRRSLVRIVTWSTPFLALLAGCGGGGGGVATPGAVAPGVVEAATGTMTKGAAAQKGGNLLKNADFEDGVVSPWTAAVNPPAKGSAAVVDGELCFDVTSGGKNGYDVLVRQRPLELRRHRSYQLRFTAHASAPTKLRPRVSTVSSPSRELWSAVVDVDTQKSTYFTTLKVDDAMEADAEFVVHLGGGLTGTTPLKVCFDDFGFDDPELKATEGAGAALPKVRVNQLGYAPKLPKLAVYKSKDKVALDWKLVDSAGATVTSGKTKPLGEDKEAGELIHQIDFSAATTPAKGLVLVVGTDKSDPFDIDTTLYERLKYDSLAFYYQQRSGMPIEMPYAADPKWVRGAGHPGDTKIACAPNSGCSYTLDVSGGWYDAGDHGKYVVNGGISVWTLLAWYERTKHLGSSIADYGDGKLNIPEGKNQKPDLLDEVRYELEFLMKMQVPEGQKLAGMAHHKLHQLKWTGIPTAPDKDNEPRYLKPPSTAATLNLAAVAAQAARLFKGVDDAFAAKCLASAERAYAAAEKNPKLFAPGDDKEGGGPYGDIDVTDEKYWAAVELYVTTGKADYQKAMTASPHYLKVPVSAGGGMSSLAWQNVAGLGTVTLVLAPNGLPKADIEKARTAVVSAATRFQDASLKTGYRVPFASSGGRYPWGSNSFVANNGVILSLAYDLTKKEQFRDGAFDALNYLLGRNPMAKSYVTGYGERPLQNPHHRFWAHQANDQFPVPPPGILSGGPNSGIDDPKAKSAGLGGCAAQKCYIDDIESWSTNEIAINWNAPLVWLAGFADEKSKGK